MVKAAGNFDFQQISKSFYKVCIMEYNISNTSFILEESMAKKKRKKKSTVFMTVLVTVLSLTIVTFFVVVCAFFASVSNNKESESYVGSGIANEIATESVSIKINMENCMMEVGTKTQVTATIYPSGSSAGVLWTSSDNNVFTVDANGNLEVIGTGIVALTATFGTASDSIAIECVAVSDDAVLQLPNYSVFNQNSGNNTNVTPSAGNNETTGNSSSAASDVTTGSTANQPTSTAAASGSTTVATKPVATKPVVTTQQPTTKKPSSNAEPTSYVIPTTPPYEGVKVLSTEIAGNLLGYGFSQYLDNTYVFEENDTFLGEVIISSNMTHIYIKERTAGYDNAIMEVLKVLLPESNDEIWDMYTGASSDRTVTVDGRVVRVVVPSGEGHTQIVIYN